MRLSISVYIILHLAKQQCHIFMKIMQTCFRYIEDVHTYIYRFIEFAHFYRDQILQKDATTMKIRFRDHCHRISHFNVKSRTSTWLRTFFMNLPKIALFISLYKFFSNSMFTRVLKFVLSSIYSRSHKD